jgi:predicted O-methyltransferase YrrM
LVVNYIRFVDYQAAGFWGSLTDEEEEALSSIIERYCKDQGPIIEFGTLFGTTTLLMAGRKGLNQRLITLDNFSWNPFMMPNKDHERFTRRCLRYVIDNSSVELVNDDINLFKSNWEGGAPALVFLDADHRYEAVKSDIEWSVDSGAKVICGHDFGTEWPGVERAVREIFGSNFSTSGSLWWSVA